MRVVFRIGMGVVQAVHDAVSAWTQKRRSLPNEGQDVEELFPAGAHDKHLVSRVAMQEKGLRENGEIPVAGKKRKNNQHGRIGKQ